MALFSTLNIWHFTTPECDLNTIIPGTGAAYDAKNSQICLGLSGNSSLPLRVTWDGASKAVLSEAEPWKEGSPRESLLPNLETVPLVPRAT